ncbi:MAG: aldo/keto reductase [Ignavibacteriaceae bacterium]|nr:aldo/keto reductase [Ignavibacteriaceae bacterium]
MNYRRFGHTEFEVSEVGFGAWGIGGAAMAGNIPIGWGATDDTVSKAAILKAYDLGINFFDTADFYGFGKSEALIGETIANKKDAIIATKVGHRLEADGSIVLDYSKNYIMQACEKSLKRLKRNEIDLYQLHSAKLVHLEQGECIEAMERLKEQGKIRYWGISLNTFNPQPEYNFLKKTGLCSSYQLVFNILNQRALSLIQEAENENNAVIARMVLQFGLLSGNMSHERKFEENDHRSFRLSPDFIKSVNTAMKRVWDSAKKKGMNPTELAVSFCLWQRGIATVIPGIKTPAQAQTNASSVKEYDQYLDNLLKNLYDEELHKFTEKMEKMG